MSMFRTNRKQAPTFDQEPFDPRKLMHPYEEASRYTSVQERAQWAEAFDQQTRNESETELGDQIADHQQSQREQEGYEPSLADELGVQIPDNTLYRIFIENGPLTYLDTTRTFVHYTDAQGETMFAPAGEAAWDLGPGTHNVLAQTSLPTTPTTSPSTSREQAHTMISEARIQVDQDHEVSYLARSATRAERIALQAAADYENEYQLPGFDEPEV